MIKYIDADRLIRRLENRTYKAVPNFIKMINEQEAADVQEVKHGKWVMDENPHDGDCRCSVCKVAIDQMHERNHGLLNALTGGKWWTFYRYCPNCGSRMDLGGDTE